MRFLSVAAVGLFTVCCLAFASVCCAGPTITVGERVPVSKRTPLQRIDHSTWDALLKRYVDVHGFVAYARWKASATDQTSLDAYLNQLSAVSIAREASRESRLAFWINAYNALTVKGILREYPTTSIRNHTAKLFGYNIWNDLQLLVADRSISLDEIEHQVLRKMGEPRIHFAIVCASIGCPRLLNEAYVPQRLDEQLTMNARAFFADSSKFRADENAATIYASPILKWFAEDFGKDSAAQLGRIAAYLPNDAQPLARSRKAKLRYLEYDWALNDQAKQRTAGSR